MSNTYKISKIIKVLYPDNVIPNFDRAMIEVNAIETYLKITEGKKVEQDAQSKEKKVREKKPLLMEDLTKKYTIEYHNAAIDKVVAAIKASGFLTLKRMSEVTGYPTHGSKMGTLINYLKTSSNIVEEKVTIPYGRGYSRIFKSTT